MESFHRVHIRRMHLIAAAILVLTSASNASAEDTKTAEAAHPLGGPGIKIDAGYRGLLSDRTESIYYNLDVLGKSLTQRGKEMKDAQSYTNLPTFRDDTPQLRFTLDRGITKADGPLAKYLQVSNLPHISGIRGVVQGFGSLEDTSSIGFTAGLETLPLFVPLKGVSNFTTIGVAAGTQPDPAGQNANNGKRASRDVGVVAYRQFIAYSPLDVYSRFRQNVRAVGVALNSSATPEQVLDLYTRLIKGGEAPLSVIAADETVKKALENLSDDEKQSLESDLKHSAAFNVGRLVGVLPVQSGTDIAKALLEGTENRTYSALKDELDIAATTPPFQPVDDYLRNGENTLLVVSRYIVSFGLVQAHSKEEARKYVTDKLKLASVPQPVDTWISLAFAATVTPARKAAALAVGNRILLETILKPLGDHPLAQDKLGNVLLNLYRYKDRPRYVALVENTGQYYFSGPSGNGSTRLNHLLAASLTYYTNPAEVKRGFLRVRFENGRDRADPKAYINQVTGTVGLEF